MGQTIARILTGILDMAVQNIWKAPGQVKATYEMLLARKPDQQVSPEIFHPNDSESAQSSQVKCNSKAPGGYWSCRVYEARKELISYF